MLPLYAAFSLVGAVVFLCYAIIKLRPYLLIPGNKYLFYNIFADLKYFNFRKELGVQALEVIARLRNDFPSEPLTCVWLSYFPLPMAWRSDAAREILKENKIIDKSFHYKWLEALAGEGLLTSGGDKWKSRRKLFNPCFHSDLLRNFLETFNKKSQKLVKILQKETQNNSCEILEPLTICALDTVCETIFGTAVKVLESDKMEVSNAIKCFASTFMTRVYTFWIWPDFIFWKTKHGKVVKNHLRIVNEFAHKLTEESKKIYLSREKTVYNGKQKPLIDILLQKHLETKEFSEEDVREEVITFMATGHDTVGLAVMWALYLIGQHPEVQAKLHEETDRIFGDDKERALTQEDFKDLQYMDCVLKESMRLYPTAPLIARTVTEETKICGSTFPKGTTCCVLIYLLHRDKDVFPNPEVFDPDRFSFENRKKIPEFAYIPFSGGPRNCIGHKFAELEVGTIVSWILRNFTVEALNKVVPVPGISLHPSEPVRIRIRSRNSIKTGR